MHILYLHQYFATPHGTTGTRSYEFAKRWVAAGHRVTMLTSTAALSKADLGDRKPSLVNRLSIDGIDVVALGVKYHQSMGYARRVWSFLSFMLMACWFVLVSRGVDVLYASSTPLTIGIPALLGRKLRGRKYVFEVRDLWPAVPIEMGVLRNSLLIRVLKLLERTIYRNAAAVVTLSESMSEFVRQLVQESTPVVTVENCADTELFTPNDERVLVRRQRRWENRCVLVHTGAMGRVNGLDSVIRAADYFRSDPDYLFVLIGDGREKERLIAERRRLELSNLDILPSVPKHELPPLIAAADICLLTVTDVAILEYNSANKLFDYLSSGKAVVLNYGGWQRQELESARAGLGCTMGDEQAFFANLKLLKEDPELRREMGKQARKLAIERFSRDALAGKALEVVVEAFR